MRIAHVVQSLDPAMGGLATVPITMARWQAIVGAPQGHEIELWTAEAHGAHDAARSTALRVIERPGPPGRFDREFVARFDADLRRVDLIHLHSFWRPYAARFVAAAQKLGKPSVQSMHGMFMEWPMAQKRLKKRLYLALTGRRALRTLSAVHMLNRSETEQSRRVGIDFRYFELPNGVDVSEFAAPPARGDFRDRHPALADRIVITSLGRLHTVKGVDLLLEAFLACAARRDDIALVLAGPDEGMLESLNRTLAEHPARDRVILPGLVKGADRLALLADTDLFVQSSRHETMSMAILEAAYASLPLVVTDRCNAPEVAECGAGVVVGADAESLRGGLDAMLGDPVRRRTCGAAARRMVEERFTLDRVTPAMLEHYRRLIAGERCPWVLG